jgi:hypothetical protein
LLKRALSTVEPYIDCIQAVSLPFVNGSPIGHNLARCRPGLAGLGHHCK